MRSVVRNGPAANATRPPLAGDTLATVDGYDVRGLGLAQLRPFLAGEDGSVVTLGFQGPSGRYETSVIRSITSSVPVHLARSDLAPPSGRSPPSFRGRSTSPAPPDYDAWRRDPIYDPAASSDGHGSPQSSMEEGFLPRAAQTHPVPNGPGVLASKMHGSDPEPSARGRGPSVRETPPRRASLPPEPAFASVESPSARRSVQSSWAQEADKILAEAQAKINDALQRERLLQETLDMLREKNELKIRARQQTRARLEEQREKLKSALDGERERLNWEGRQRDAIKMELHKSEQRLLQLTSHLDRDTVERALF